MTGRSRSVVAAPAWYADSVGAPLVSHDDVLRLLPRPIASLAGRVGAVRGLALAFATRRGALAVIKGLPGTGTALVASALLHRGRRVVVLEFLRRPESASAVRRVLHDLLRRFVEAPAMRRAMAVGHTLTTWEVEKYARDYGIEETRFEEVRWPLCRWGSEPVTDVAEQGTRVLSSGRAHSDWETLFEAAEGADWELVAICSRLDLARVRRLGGGRAEVHSELGRAEHDALLRASDVYVMAMREANASAGHVRLMSAVEAGVPVIASGIRALDGYVTADETAVLVAPGDSAGLRSAIDSLLSDAAARRRLRDTALARAREWTYEHYFERMRALILEPVAEG